MMAKPDSGLKPPPSPAFRSNSGLAAPFDPLFKILRPLRSAVDHWIDAGGMRMSAAMSFYGILSLAPLLVLLVAVLVDGWQLLLGSLSQSFY